MSEPNDRWNGAKFFGSPDAEYVDCDCPEEAARQEFDGWLSVSMTDHEVAKLADEMEIEVAGYRPQRVGQGKIAYAARLSAESIEERLVEEFGGPDFVSVLGEEGEAALARSITAEVTRLLRERDVWCCDIVAQHTYTGAELLAACGLDARGLRTASPAERIEEGREDV